MAMSSLLSSSAFSPHRFKLNGLSNSNFIFSPLTLSTQSLNKPASTKSSKPFTVQSKGTDSADAPDRLISAICYFYPFFDGIQYGKYVITQFSPIATLIQPFVPAIKVFKSFPFNGFLVFLTLYFVVVRNQNFSRYVRFNTMQAIVLDVLLIFPDLLERSFNPREGLGLDVLMSVDSTVFLFLLVCLIYGSSSCLLGQLPRLPLVADAADRLKDASSHYGFCSVTSLNSKQRVVVFARKMQSREMESIHTTMEELMPLNIITNFFSTNFHAELIVQDAAAAKMASLVHHRLLRSLSSFPSIFSPSNTHLNPSAISLKPTFHLKPLIVRSALAESDSPKSIGPNTQSLLEEVATSFELPSDYFSQLPRDLRLDLNDAAFDLSNGPVIDECGLELGELLLNLSRAWEQADTSTSRALASQLPKIESSLSPNAKSALGKRLVSSGRKFQSMGQYGEGELAKIAKAMIATGKILAATQVSETPVEPSKSESRMFKFGELQVAITSEQANIGAFNGFGFGALSWGLTQGIQDIPESSLQYANDNALLLAKSLRGALIAIGYSSTVLSGL